MEVILTNDNFDEEVLNSDKPVLVDFWADWCGPCKMLAPIIEEVAKDLEGTIKVGKLNVDEAPDIAARYGISSIPTLIVFKDKEEKNRGVGVMTKAQIEAMLK